MVTPFLAERIWGEMPFKIELDLCEACSFYFFNPRLEELEIIRLYNDYRGPAYQEMRHKHEQWYPKEVNDLMGNNNIELVNRKKNLAAMLNKYSDVNAIHSVLDYGGDRGQFIIDELSDERRYVYEVSGIEPLEGIIKINDLAGCKDNNYDFIMCCHVLEHVSDPAETVRNIRTLSNNETIVYIEVPYELPFMSGKLKRWQSTLKKMLMTNPLGLVKAAFSMFNVNMPKAWMHEHVNFYTERSIDALLSKNGFTIIAIETPEIDTSLSTTKVISCFAKPKAI